MSIYTRMSRLLARHTAHRWLPLNKGRGVVSFSFDDVPASACREGAALLERYEARGTFYVCGGLTDGVEQNQPCHQVSDLHRLVSRGHEVGCHTFSHTNCAEANLRFLRDDWRKNQDFFTEHNVKNSGFAFPFGAYDFPSKLAAASLFSYSRITGGGTHVRRADLNALRAQSLYAGVTSDQAILNLIQNTADEGGWLIFYSHEVSSSPGPWGTSPTQLESALRIARQMSCEILPVQSAIDYFRQP